MSKEILNSLIANYNQVNGYFEEFIQRCPDKIWVEKIGNFPVWQQVYHAYATYDYFLSESDAQPTLKQLYPIEVVLFKTVPEVPPAKNSIAALIKEANVYIEKFFASLDDQKLGKKHAGFSTRREQPVTNAGVINIIVGHLFYHFGQCDAALRDNGLEGIF
jgi:uncharacterized damage-inducible protein DinB